MCLIGQMGCKSLLNSENEKYFNQLDLNSFKKSLKIPKG